MPFNVAPSDVERGCCEGVAEDNDDVGAMKADVDAGADMAAKDAVAMAMALVRRENFMVGG